MAYWALQNVLLVLLKPTERLLMRGLVSEWGAGRGWCGPTKVQIIKINE